jgi:adenylate cyclase
VSRSRVYLIPVVVAFIVSAACGILQPRLLDDLGNFIFDRMQRLSPRVFDRNGPVRVVAIDEDSLAAYGQWPWPRTRLADVTRKLTDLGAAAVVFDIIFSEPDRTSLETIVPTMPAGDARDDLARKVAILPTYDQTFAAALSEAPAVLGFTLLPRGAPRTVAAKAGFVAAGDDPAPFVAVFRSAAVPLPVLADAAKGLGATNWLPDRDLVVRRVPLVMRLDATMLPSLAVEALRVAQGASTIVIRSSNASGQEAFGRQTGINAIKVGDREIETGPHADVRPYFTKTRAERFIPIGQVLHDAVSREDIAGRIIFVGTTAIGLGDVRATPLDAAVPGVEIHAQIVESVLSGDLLSRPDWAPGAELVLGLLLFVLVAATLPLLPPVLCAALVAATSAACLVGAFLAFRHAKLLIDPAFPVLTMACAYTAGTMALWRSERLSRRHVRTAFGKFLSPAVVDRLAADPRGLVLGGEMRDLTIMFSDLRNFSGISEGLDAQSLTQFMNAYLTPMTDTILDCEGTVDKYIGDAIVAFWNAPLDVTDHPAKAVGAALRMRDALAAFNRQREAEATANRPFHRAAMGIGLNCGPCTVGNMGSLRRFDYSVLGDTVNLASRLEGVCKIYGVDIIASESVVRQAPGFAWLEIERVRVKGRSEATTLFTVAGDRAFAQSDAFRAWLAAHDAMLARFAAGDGAAASTGAKTLGDHAPPAWRNLYEEMAARAASVAERPQGQEIARVRELETK